MHRLRYDIIFNMKTVMICLNPWGIAERQFLTGICSYVHARTDWQFRLEAHPDRLTLNRFLTDAANFDGAIICETKVDELDAIAARTSKPLVIYGPPRASAARGNIAFITSDDTAIGRAGAAHLFSQGNFRTYLFIPDPDGAEWSVERGKGFAAFAMGKGKSVFTYDWSGQRHETAALGLWINSFPKPVAIMAAEDPVALVTVNACQSVGLSIPQQASIIGVNNDTLICSLTDPPLSSIDTNYEEEGRQAARVLASLMRRKARKTRIICCRENEVVERGTTAPVIPAAHIVTAARSYILENAEQDLTVTDVAHHLGISRRLLDVRFRQFDNQTVNQTIVEARLDFIRRKLGETHLSIGKLARSCHFHDLSYLATIFRRRFGCSMSEYRARNNAPQSHQS